MPGSRRPGPTCVTTADGIDEGTNCRATSPRPGPLGVDDPAPALAPALSFQTLWNAYPSDPPYVDRRGNPPPGYENQCAIKVSAALIGAGVSLKGFKGAVVSIGAQPHAIRAQELAGWLSAAAPRRIRDKAKGITGAAWQNTIADKTGIVYFENYWLRDGEKAPTGDHIDLWNGSRLTASGLQGAIVSALRFGLGIGSGPGFSDLAKATKIVFWEVP
jgi:Type VI secretion system (T6SS), amidase effector protein 4